MAPKPRYETNNQTRHSPKVTATKDGLHVDIVAEPLCGKPSGPGTTTIIDCQVTCPDCTMMLAEGHGRAR